MFRVLGRLASRFPWLIIAAWGVIGVLLVAFAPSVGTTTNQADFLPHHYESIQATDVLQKAFPQAAQQGGATLVFSHQNGSALSQADLGKIDQIAGSINPDGKTLTALTPPTKGQDGHYFQAAPDGKNRAAIVNLSMATGHDGQSNGDLDQIKTLRDHLASSVKGTDLKVGVTGTLAQSYDQSQSGSNAEAIVGIATVLLIVILLSLIFRSGLVTALPVVLIGAVLTPVSNALINYAADWFNLQKDDSTSVIMIVVLFGVGTDYVLFYLFRYRERLRAGADHADAVEFALERAGEAIVSAGGAVFVAFMTLVLSSLGIFRSIGPSLAIGVGVTLIAAITLVPAVVSIMGPLVLWPSKDYQRTRHQFTVRNRGRRIASVVAFVVIFFPLVVLGLFLGVAIWAAGWPTRNGREWRASVKESFSRRPAVSTLMTIGMVLAFAPLILGLLIGLVVWPFKHGKQPDAEVGDSRLFGRLGRSLAARPARFALVSGGVLVILAIFALGFTPSFDLSSAQSASNVESAQATSTMEAKGFSAGATEPTPVVLSSGKPLTQADVMAFAAKLKSVEGVSSVAGGLVAPGDPKTGIVELILNADPTSQAAIDIVKQDLRPAAHRFAAETGTKAFVGGTASVFVDFQSAMNRDYSVVFPVAALIILLILGLVLRSLVAPWYLMISVGLGFAATLGATVLVFQHLKGDHGLIFLLPIYIYLFVVALGTDYNILMVTRLREEAREGKAPREAAAEAVKHAGPTVGAAGLILAGTFASLMLAGNSLLLTMGFAISFGIVVAAFVMAMFFTPAVTALIGHAAWWPGHADEPKEDHELTHAG